MTDTSDETPDPSIAGSITPPVDGEGPAIFEVIERRQDSRVSSIGVANVRPCDHVSGKVTYVLDEKWQTVTCSKCQTQIPAFAVLMLYSEWNQRHRSNKLAAESAERSLHVTNLRRILKLRGVSEGETKEIKKALAWYGDTPPRDLAKMAQRIEDAIDGRKPAPKNRAPHIGPPTTVIGG